MDLYFLESNFHQLSLWMAVKVFKQKNYIKISDLVDVVSCLKKIKTKNLDQNKDILINYLIKNYGCSKDLLMRLNMQSKKIWQKLFCIARRTLLELLRTGRTRLLNDTKLNDRNTLTIEKTQMTLR